MFLSAIDGIYSCTYDVALLNENIFYLLSIDTLLLVI